ncbi:DUF4097 family beta strand repeat-containing protein [Chengkuizengella axinellae]|uniref:DUF4097 family beta strand repeat-containing protein n=1 Tax=Chengkuizengella axinellae TaxID=3064388 RepID=A0ABT9J6N1_9BACL|nr:DUF4097 family beta strand repeat-containing protein [Chengkuizengella sp. 2205SS18-9]MDP5277097.1 DUF4097 family beta strand repeat-containing protein [Chengkuizengella sp. 2205SS18-9]
MNRNEFMNQLKLLLKDVHEIDRREILYDFSEHFDIGLENGKSEEELVRELGDPQVIAKDLLADYRATKEEDKPIGTKYKGMLANFRENFFNTVDIFEEKIVSGETYTNIHINSSSTDVIVIPTDIDEIKVTLSGEASKRYEEAISLSLKETRDTLQIKLKQKPLLFNVGFSMIKVDLRVEIPQKLYDSFKVNVSSGDIQAKELQTKELNLSTNSGDVEVEQFQAENAQLFTSSGNVSAKDGTVSSKFTIESSSGDIISDNIINNSLTMEATSGNLQLTNNVAKSSVLKAVSGNIKIMNDEIQGDINAKTMSGNITIDIEQDNESLSLDFKTTSGDIVVKREGYLYEEKSSSQVFGKIGSGEYTIKARALSGDVSLK